MNTKTKALSESALITALICVIGLVGVYVPPAGILVTVGFAMLVVLGKIHGIKYASISLAAVFIILSLLVGPLQAISMVLLSGLSSLVLGGLLHLNKPPYQVIGAGILTALASTIIMMGLAQMITGISMADTIKLAFDESFKMQQSMYGLLGSDPKTIKETTDIMLNVKEQLLLVIPAIIVMASAVSTLLNYWIATLIFKRLRIQILPLSPFREFALPKSVLWGTIIIYGLSLGVSYFKIVDEKILMANVQMLMTYTFAIQGLSVVVWYMHRRNIRKLFAAIIIIFLLTSSIGIMIIFMLGVSEVAIHFRRKFDSASLQK